jgi:AraC family transcriptional regulator of adaptative response/methylated-DNA-[protein]-cysteine methyltransferase
MRDGMSLRADLDKILTFIETPAKGLDLPLDIRGTPFQRRVWDTLLAIRVGYKITYAALASRVGEPGAIRAVANACAANAIALAIPCHRVVSSDGALAGYRWGVERKRFMLEREAQAIEGAGGVR